MNTYLMSNLLLLINNVTLKKKKRIESWYIQMSSRHMKRCSVTLIIRVMQIKTIMSYNLTPIRMALINKSTNNSCW